jgi:shikimate dehydrogenase
MPAPSINSNTELVGLIGWPVEHSLSPAMHNAAFEALGLNWRYVPLPVPPGQVQAAVLGLAALGFRGANVTVPHKQAAAATVEQAFGPDAIAADARAIGAVNTLVVDRGQDADVRISAHNTDGSGFVEALRDAGFHPESTSTIVVGAGGAARAVVSGLLKTEAESIVVLNRTLERAEVLAADLNRAAEVAPPMVRPLPLTHEVLIEVAHTAQLLVNATPVGMWPHVDHSVWPEGVALPPHLTVFDVVYNPLETRLIRQARASGARAIEGLGMLVHQGALAFEMWTGKQAPVRVMHAACTRAMGPEPR